MKKIPIKTCFDNDIQIGDKVFIPKNSQFIIIDGIFIEPKPETLQNDKIGTVLSINEKYISIILKDDTTGFILNIIKNP